MLPVHRANLKNNRRLFCNLDGMNPKPQPNHELYLQTLRNLGPAGRFQKAMELSAFTKELFLHGLRTRFPEKSEAEIKSLYLQRLALCHNMNY